MWSPRYECLASESRKVFYLKVDIHCASKSHWDFPIPCKNTDHISLWISVQIYPHLSLKLRQTKNLRFRSSPEIGLKSHGNLALKWLKTWELRRKIDEVEGSQSKVRVRLKRPPSATYMSLIWFGRWWKPTVLWLNCHLFSYCYSLQFICNFATLVRPINFYNEPFVILNFDPRPSSNNAGDPILSLTRGRENCFHQFCLHISLSVE